MECGSTTLVNLKVDNRPLAGVSDRLEGHNAVFFFERYDRRIRGGVD